ncbi:MAG TPA: hypothetical protein DCQ33_12610, partial [Nitrospira sp.]|nr:hypothetical protein [Nitrospira sp.]
MNPEKIANSHDPVARIKDIETRVRQRSRPRCEQAASAPDGQEKPPSANIIKLPLWPEAVRAVPNGFLRSALFGAIGKGRRRYMECESIATLEGIEIRYTGSRLDQGDLDVWESVLQIVRFQAMGEPCRVTSYALLKLMGKT